MTDTTEWATIGKIVAPFGIHGELKVQPSTDIPDRFVTLEAVYLSPRYHLSTIEAVRPYKEDMLLIKFQGIDDVTAAEALCNSELCVPLSALPELPSGCYYQHDIVGLQVLKLDGNLVGVVEEIMSTGGNDVYIVKAPDKKQILIPAIKEVVKQIDLIRHVMYIDPMKGLLDDDEMIDDQTEQ
jgi:16S rRNA processing protein RimM